MHMIKQIETERAPTAFGPFCQATCVDGVVYTSGALPLDPVTGLVVGETLEEQTEQTMRNLIAVLEAAGSSLEKTACITIYITNMDEFDRLNEVYQGFFTSALPARVVVGVSSLAKQAKVEMQAIAYCHVKG